MRGWLLLGLGVGAAAIATGAAVHHRAAKAAPAGPRAPVLVELFSSEGCSSCPPADEELRRLDREQPVAGAHVIALELHVDYWNRLGWTDPFSSAAFSDRQRAYARSFVGAGVYTPQMVIDGASELVGSRGAAAERAIALAARTPKAKVTLVRAGDTLRVDVNGAGVADASAADVLLAVVERGLSTHVTRGENGGLTLEHGPVVRSLRRLGSLAGRAYHGTVTQPAKAGTRSVVFVQSRANLHVVGAAEAD